MCQRICGTQNMTLLAKTTAGDMCKLASFFHNSAENLLTGKYTCHLILLAAFSWDKTDSKAKQAPDSAR